jgi:hypothetical protein
MYKYSQATIVLIQFVPLQFIIGEIWAKNRHFCKVLKLHLCLTKLGKI